MVEPIEINGQTKCSSVLMAGPYRENHSGNSGSGQTSWGDHGGKKSSWVNQLKWPDYVGWTTDTGPTTVPKQGMLGEPWSHTGTWPSPWSADPVRALKVA